MQSVQQRSGAWSRRLWIAVAVLTAMGVVGTWVLFFVLFPINEGIRAGCGGLGGVLLLFMLLMLMILALIGALAAAGLILFWIRSRWGPLLLVPSNAMAMGFIGWIYPVPASIFWVVLLLGAAPALAVAVLIWPLLTRGRHWVKVSELVVLGLFALPFLWLYSAGLTKDVQAAFAAPPPSVASTSCSGSTGWQQARARASVKVSLTP